MVTEPVGGRGGDGARGWLAAAGVFAAVLAAFFAPALSPNAQFLYRDAGRMHAPVKQVVAERWSHAHLPEWLAEDGLGTPLVADPIHAVQHPFNLLLVALPFAAAFKAWVLASCLAAALGAFAWARRLGASAAGGIAAGLAYALSGFVVSSSDNLTYLTAAAFAPWILAAGHAFATSGGAGGLLAVAAASFACAAAGDPPTWAIATALVPVQAAIVAPGVRRRFAARGALAAAAAAIAAAPVLLPMLAWIPLSARADASTAATRGIWNLHPLRLAELALPHLTRDPALDTSNEILRVFAGAPAGVGPWVLSIYVGVAVLLLATAAAQERGPARPLLLAAALFLWAAMGPYAGFAAVAERLPVLRSLRFWEKLTLWPTLLAAVAAGLGVTRALADRRAARRLAWTAAVAAAVLAAATAATWALDVVDRGAPGTRAATDALAANLAEGTLHALVVAALLAAVAAARAAGRLGALAPATLVLVAAADLFSANVRAYRLAPPPGPKPSAVRRALGDGRGMPSIVTPFRLESGAWRDLPPYAAKWRFGADTDYPMWSAAEGVRNATPYGAMHPLRYARWHARTPLATRVAALGLFGVGDVVVTGEPDALGATALRPPWDVAAADAAAGFTLVRVPHRPRAYVARDVALASTDEALAFASDPGSVLSGRTVVEGALPPGVGGAIGTAEVVLDAPERVELAVTTDLPGIVVLNDAWAPGWTATVDGRPAAILPANYAVRGVATEGGAHRVVFTYRTPLLVTGWATAGALVLGAAAAAVARRRS